MHYHKQKNIAFHFEGIQGSIFPTEVENESEAVTAAGMVKGCENKCVFYHQFPKTSYLHSR